MPTPKPLLSLMSIEYPGGLVPLDSPFYVERPPVETLAAAELDRPGSVIRVRAPRKMGKSSLLLRLLTQARARGYRTASLNFQQAEAATFSNLNRFLRWFAATISYQLALPPNLDEFWDVDIGSKVSCSLYMQAYLLAQSETPLVLALSEVNCLFAETAIASDFFALLRSWHEEARHNTELQKLRLIVMHSTEVYLALNIHQSPFNVGLPIQLPPFSLAQTQDLAQRHALTWTANSPGRERLQQLWELVGGHPFLIRIALYQLALGTVELGQLLDEAAMLSGIYGGHLRLLLDAIRDQPDLEAAVECLLQNPEGVTLEATLAYQLESIGLVKLVGDRAMLWCDLYRDYFRRQLSGWTQERLTELERQNQALQRLAHLDNLTEIANRRLFDTYLQQSWEQAQRLQHPLSLVFIDIDCFKRYNDTFGHLQGDTCLRAVARCIRDAIADPAGLACRYGGEEFAVILPGVERSNAVHLAATIREQVQVLDIHHEAEFAGSLPAAVVTVSAGVAATIPAACDEPRDLICAADRALYIAKCNGRNRVEVYETADVGRV